jgi:TonB family protein
MNRLQKKCFIGSAGMHLLLVLILFVGPAFLSPKPKSQEYVILDVIPAKLIDGQFSGGGNPNVKLPPPPAPVRDAAPPAPRQRREPEPPKPAPEPKAEQESFEPKPDKVKKPVVSTKTVVRNSNNKTTTKQRTTSEVADKLVTDNRRQVAKLIAQTAQSLDRSSTSVEMPSIGPGSGEAYASYAQVVQSIYFHQWIVPEDTESNNAITKVMVTIANDGTVISWRVLRPSGDAMVDRSVERTLERVTFIAPFPEGAKEKQRTYTINFNLSAKRAIG